MKTVIATIIFSLFTADKIYAFSSNSCNGMQVEMIRNIENEAVKEIDGWIAKLQEKYRIDLTKVFKYRQGETQNVYGDSILSGISHAENAAVIALCAQDKLKGALDYACYNEPDKEYAAQTFPIFFRTIKINTFFWNYSIRRKIGAIIHEATHKCGTTDAANFRGTSPRNIGLIPWALIADTYEHWVAERFCIPQIDCP